MTEEKNSKDLLTRDQVAEELTWRLEDIFESDDIWEKELKEVKAMIPDGANYSGKLGDNVEVMYEALQLQDEIGSRLGKLYTYAHMRSDQDTSKSKYQDMEGRARIVYTEYGSTFSYVTPELLEIDEAALEKMISEKEEMKVYTQAFKEINLQRKHVLSKEEEAILAQASDPLGAASDVFGMLSNADMKFPKIKDEDGDEVELTHGRYVSFLESENREVRKAAFDTMYETYGNFRNTFASTLNSQVKKNGFISKVRKFDSPRHAALSGNNIPETVYDNLVKTVNDNLHLLHRYLEIRERVLGLDELHMYDLYTPLVGEMKMKIPYAEAKDYLLESLAPLGEEYKAVLEEGFENRWVDVVETRGKRSGAYSSGTYGTNPYILMNWQDDLNNLFTLAHEFGHSVHSYFTRNNQPLQTGDYSIFVAEVASTCNEALLTDYLLKKLTDKKSKMYVLNHHLETFRGTLFRQTMFAEFEHEIHQKSMEGATLTADYFTETYYALCKKYFGEGVTVDEEIGLEWSRIPHFYYNFYVYQYATGISAATALSQQILEEGEVAVERYINEFLKAGSSDFSIEVLKKAGVDMNSPEPIEKALKVFEQTLDELEALLNEK